MKWGRGEEGGERNVRNVGHTRTPGPNAAPSTPTILGLSPKRPPHNHPAPSSDNFRKSFIRGRPPTLISRSTASMPPAQRAPSPRHNIRSVDGYPSHSFVQHAFAIKTLKARTHTFLHRCPIPRGPSRFNTDHTLVAPERALLRLTLRRRTYRG
ncbi:hypothetical protein BDN71DRAFT_1446885 [Pleurotus eryngii]|uniref:Uncharacterized protein n=1 Tax=Pleurotus eryngii TaxID=5323 RepID=A0A9P6DFY1_PLEER|nr:hypothetical protein BDN71DRAFT_1446885 [Pleurotus eryngii]